jgi:hypothetical protein
MENSQSLIFEDEEEIFEDDEEEGFFIEEDIDDEFGTGLIGSYVKKIVFDLKGKWGDKLDQQK